MSSSEKGTVIIFKMISRDMYYLVTKPVICLIYKLKWQALISS